MGGGASSHAHPPPQGQGGWGTGAAVAPGSPLFSISALPPMPGLAPSGAVQWTSAHFTQTIADSSCILHAGHDNQKQVLCFARGRLPDGSIRIGSRAVTPQGYLRGHASIAFNGAEVQLDDCEVLVASPNLCLSPMQVGGPPPPNAVVCGQIGAQAVFAGCATLSVNNSPELIVVPGTVTPQGIMIGLMGKQINIAGGIVSVLCVQPAYNPAGWAPPYTNGQYWDQLSRQNQAMQIAASALGQGQGLGTLYRQQQPQQPFPGQPQYVPGQQQQQQQQHFPGQLKGFPGQQPHPHSHPHPGRPAGTSPMMAGAAGVAVGAVGAEAASHMGQLAGIGGDAVAWGGQAAGDAGAWAQGAAADAGSWGGQAASTAAAWGGQAAGDVGAWAPGAAASAEAWGGQAASNAAAWGGQAGGDAGAWAQGAAADAGSWGGQAAGDAGAWVQDAAADVGSWGGQAVEDMSAWASSAGDAIESFDFGGAMEGLSNAFE